MTAPGGIHDAYKLHRLYRRLWQAEPECVWEVGSRDGKDGEMLASAFSAATVFCFEPNPDTWALVSSAAETHPRLRALQMALSNIDGETDFFKIDTERTRSSWSDGNPGASSLFQASGDYAIERYEQVKVPVRVGRAETVIERQEAGSPQVVWMDVQGAELLALEGFGERLDDVRLISVELSLTPIYRGQPVAEEVVDFLSTRGFRWHSVLHPGEWQFDAVFVKASNSWSLALRDEALRRSLASSRQICVRATLSQAVRAGSGRWLRREVRKAGGIAAPSLARSESKTVAEVVTRALIASRGRQDSDGVQPLSVTGRLLLESAQRSDPLAQDARSGLPPTIDIVIPCALGDLPILKSCVELARRACTNPIGDVTIILPTDLLAISEGLGVHATSCVSEQALLSSDVLQAVDSRVPGPRRGWVVQQLVKFVAVALSNAEGVLVLDADTLLLRRRTWLRDGVQVLLPSHEFHPPYARHLAQVFGIPESSQLLSFVTHHQVMQPRVLLNMFDAIGGFESGLTRWLEQGDFSSDSSVSEYHSYGSWLWAKRPDDFVLARWGNLAMPRSEVMNATEKMEPEQLLQHLRANHPRAMSLSLHGYL